MAERFGVEFLTSLGRSRGGVAELDGDELEGGVG